MKILAIVIDGFHKGHTMRMEYNPIIKLFRPKVIRVDYCCNMDEFPTEKGIEEYKACFTAVDKKVVLYSVKGESEKIFDMFPHEVSSRPWTRNTYLKMGYHDEEVIRLEENESPLSAL